MVRNGSKPFSVGVSVWSSMAVLAVALLLGLMASYPSVVSSQPLSPRANNPFLLSVYFKARQLKDRGDQAIAKLEEEIKKNRDSAARAKKLIELAAQRTDESARRAGQIAAQALKLSEESLARNEETLKEWKIRKARAERSMAAIKDMLAGGPARSVGILGAVTDLRGGASLIKKDGSSINLADGPPGFLEASDKLKTSEGPADLNLLGGRAVARLDRDSELEILDGTSDEHRIELLKGRFHGAVDKADDFLARLKQGIQDYREELTAVSELFTDDELRERVLKQLKLYFREWDRRINPQLQVTAVCGVRGTEIVAERLADGGWTLWVLEGKVDLFFPESGQTVLVESGYTCSYSNGHLSGPLRFDSLDRWWDKPE